MSAAARSTCRSRRLPMRPAPGSASAFGRRICASPPATTVLFEGTVDYVEQLGEVQMVYLDIGIADQPLVVKLPGNAEVKRNTTLKVDRRCRHAAHLRSPRAAPSPARRSAAKAA